MATHPTNQGKRIAGEKRVIETMVRLYCHHYEGNRELCDDCSRLLEYARQRLDHCRYGEAKPTCRKCPIHCYKPDMRERMRRVMRWAGPRMMLYHPLIAMQHLFREIRH